MSRTQWSCLAAVLAAVLGLLCGGPLPTPDVTPAGTTTATETAAGTGTGTATATSDRSLPRAAAVPDMRNVVARASTDRDAGIPGCDRNRDHGGDQPGVPARSRAAHDHVPGIAGSGPPGIAPREAAPPALRIAVRGPEPATPTPVELSVLRV